MDKTYLQITDDGYSAYCTIQNAFFTNPQRVDILFEQPVDGEIKRSDEYFEIYQTLPKDNQQKLDELFERAKQRYGKNYSMLNSFMRMVHPAFTTLDTPLVYEHDENAINYLSDEQKKSLTSLENLGEKNKEKLKDVLFHSYNLECDYQEYSWIETNRPYDPSQTEMENIKNAYGIHSAQEVLEKAKLETVEIGEDGQTNFHYMVSWTVDNWVVISLEEIT